MSAKPEKIVEATEAEGSKAKIVEIKSDVEDKLRRFHDFHFEYASPVDGKSYAGDFQAQRLSIGAFGRFKVEEARLNGGMVGSLDELTRYVHMQIAYLRVALIKFPDWWAPEDFFDHALLNEVFDHVRHWESSFRR